MDAVPRPGRVAETAFLAGVGIVLAWAVLDGHGSRDGALATAGIVAIACAAAGISLGLRGTLPLPRLDRAGAVTVAAAVALTLWAGLSIWWSIAGDLSWNWLARGLVYLAFLALGALAGAPAGGARRVAALAALVVGAAIGWALLGVAIPSLFPDGDRIARLREPVGYWNALALLADAALALGLWVARSTRVTGRTAGLLLVYGTALVEDGALRADRAADGKVFAALTIGGAILVALAAWRAFATRLVERRGGPLRSTLLVLCMLGVVVASVGLVAKVGNPYSWASSQLSRGECVNDPGRLTDLCANNRLQWWGEALDVAADRPVGGSGAGTFVLARRRYRESATPVTEPHSVPLQLLADLGVVGLALGLAVVGGAVIGVRSGLRQAPGADRAAAAALACLVLAYGVHALVDYDLDFLAVTGPMLVALGALLAVGRPLATIRAGVPGLVAVCSVAVGAILAVGLPALSRHEVDSALEAIDAGRLEDAVDAAD